jgi:hypothetical protein
MQDPRQWRQKRRRGKREKRSGKRGGGKHVVINV